MTTSQRTQDELDTLAQASGLVNAHAHLELSDLKTPLGRPGTPITDWIPSLLQYRQSRTVAEVECAIQLGLQESVASGTVTLADITQGEPPFELADELGVRLIAFREMIGFTPDRTEEAIRNASDFIEKVYGRGHRGQGHRGRGHSVGLSPHAPYTICRELLDAAISLSAEKEVPLAIHLAESREELQLLADREGPFRKFLDSIDGWDPDEALLGRRPLDYLEAMDRASSLLVIHGNYLDDDELDWLADRAERATVVYCPRSHAYFGHEPYPLLKMLDKGVRVAIGTDSRASSPDLSMRAELQTVAEQFPDLSVKAILGLATRTIC